jgi:hypothetical protein
MSSETKERRGEDRWRGYLFTLSRRRLGNRSDPIRYSRCGSRIAQLSEPGKDGQKRVKFEGGGGLILSSFEFIRASARSHPGCELLPF